MAKFYKNNKKCPLCEKYVPRKSAKCKYCGSIFIDGGESVKTTGFSKGELSSRINVIRKRVNLLLLSGSLSLIAWLVLRNLHRFYNVTALPEFVLGLGGLLIIICAVETVICFYRAYTTNKILVKVIKANIINEILAETFELESYLPGKHIPNSQIDESDLIGGWSSSSGSDLVKGKYKGVPIEFCDLTLNYDGLDSENKSCAKTKFKGQWIELGFKRRVSSAVYLAEREGEIGATSVHVKTQEVKTESDAFNKKYKILAQDPQTAFYILTPHFMEYVTAADNAADSVTYFCFYGSRARIAMKNNRDLFEFGKLNKSMTLDWFRARIKSDIHYITGVVDELLKNEYLFGSADGLKGNV